MKKLLIMAVACMASILPACNNTDDLWKAVNDLTSRVQALETQVSALNKNIEALQELSKKGQTITDVQLKDGVYTITLSDGNTIVLTQGSTAQATIPIMGIDAQGYWVVDYQDGKGFKQILVDGKPIKAAGTDGATPKFKIEDTTGYWMVSTDGGAKYDYVLNDKGEKVSAFGSGAATDAFFKSVVVKDGMLEIELLTGEKLSIPVVSSFYCRILTDVAGIQLFNDGEARTFNVEIKGVDNTIITVPEGWNAQLSEPANDQAILTVTPPSTTTRASADTRTDVSILATSNYYSCIAKIQVRMSDVVIPTITLTEKPTSATSTSLTFNVGVQPASSKWYWIAQLATAPAPVAAAIVAGGAMGTAAEFTATGLKFETAYKAYVVALASDGVTYSAVVSAEATTTAMDYYNDGIEINGVTYSKDSAGAVLVSAATIITANGIYFIDTTDDVALKSGITGLSNLVIIGRTPGTRPVIKSPGIVSIGGAATGLGLIFNNITFDSKDWTNYVFNFDGAAASPTGIYDCWIMEDCRIEGPSTKAFTYFNKASSIRKISFRNNTIHLNTTAAEQAPNLINIGGSSALAGFESVDISNNVIYADSPSKVALFTTANAANKNLSVSINNNTIINCLGNPAGTAVVGAIKALSVDKNIFWSDANANLTSYIARLQSTANNGTADILDNKFFGAIKGWLVFSNTNLPSNMTENPKITAETADPFTGGTFDMAAGKFIAGPGYAGYGASL